MLCRRPYITHSSFRRQRGAALMIFLVIMVVGALALFVSSLNRTSTLQLSRDKDTAVSLAKAKEALIGRATADANLPGSLPCPDTHAPGSGLEGTADAGTPCSSYLGLLPWRTLGLPDLRDGSGERLWYALSPPFRDQTSPTAHTINSDTTGTLTITDASSGTTVASNVIAIVFAPGPVLSSQGQTRSDSSTVSCTTTGTTTAESRCATEYLEGLNATSTANANFNTGTASSSFNDQLIYITHEQLFAPVEMRIAREAKKCLDDYAAMPVSTNGNSPGNKYPWAAPVSVSGPPFDGTLNTFFGRIPDTPSNTTNSTNDALVSAMLSALSNLQTALNNYSPSNATSVTALLNAGTTLASTATSAANNQPTSPALSSTITSTADNAGDKGRDLANGVSGVTVSTVQSLIDNTNTYLANAGISTSSSTDSTMSTSWPSSCLFTSVYWPYWQNEVFYQVANGFQPGSSASFGTPLTINGSGSYRAVAAGARQLISANGAARSATNDTTYLEGVNPHATTPSTNFETYSPSSPTYSNINDLVLCVDGKVTCQ